MVNKSKEDSQMDLIEKRISYLSHRPQLNLVGSSANLGARLAPSFSDRKFGFLLRTLFLFRLSRFSYCLEYSVTSTINGL